MNALGTCQGGHETHVKAGDFQRQGCLCTMASDAESISRSSVGTDAGTLEVCLRTPKFGPCRARTWIRRAGRTDVLFIDNAPQRKLDGKGRDRPEGLRFWRLLVTEFEPEICQSEDGAAAVFSISRSVQVEIRVKEPIVWNRKSDSTSPQPRGQLAMTRFRTATNCTRKMRDRSVLNAYLVA